MRNMSSDAEYIRMLRAMTPEQKLRAAESLFDFARELNASLLRLDHPNWTQARIQSAVSEWLLNLET